MHCLEENEIAHCEYVAIVEIWRIFSFSLAARNVLVGKIDGPFPVVKVADFGMAHKANEVQNQLRRKYYICTL